jgi:hypothetical protein
VLTTGFRKRLSGEACAPVTGDDISVLVIQGKRRTARNALRELPSAARSIGVVRDPLVDLKKHLSPPLGAREA